MARRLWQERLFRQLADRIPSSAAVTRHGSAAEDGAELDGWSDLDLRLQLDRDLDAAALFPATEIWAVDDVQDDDQQTCRLVLWDGRRVDLSVGGPHRLIGLPRRSDDGFRSVAALAATRLGRGDRLIGLHLTLELLRLCLVEAMLLRDRDRGTSVHRYGSERDGYADAVTALAAMPADVLPRPNVVERAADLYGTWRTERDPGYQPDWSGLTALLDRGTAPS